MNNIGQKIFRTITFKISEINEEDRSFLAVASDNSTDRHGENILQDGWDLENFVKNPVVPWGHDYYMPPAAKATEIGMKDGKLMFRPKFPTIEELSSNPDKPSDWALFVDTIYNMYKGGYLRAFSVGFIPKEMDGDTFVKQELLEVSAVTVPSNPNALALAFKEGVIDDEQRKILIKGFQAQLDRLTKASIVEETINMDEVKTLLETTVKELKEAFASEVAELKTDFDGKLETLKSDLADQFVAKTVDEDSEEDDDANADPAEGGETPPNADEDAEAEDDSKELTDDEAKALMPSLVKDATDKLSGKVD